MDELFGPFGEMRRLRRMMRGCQGMERMDVPEDTREPLTDIMDEGEDLVALMELPGVNKDDIKVSTTADTLKVRVDKKEEKDESGEDYCYRERRYSGYYRTISLPSEVFPDKVKANYKNGILEVRMKKKAKTEGGNAVKVE
ncbi:MAG: Hsp20/alpha crystallin family protein [Candidatus Fermentimicrarchaeum limneticum]|uniref:Hsp20/alpha crystallin family protein n=1 Tax=Fermentimicrarchaeum limneticum TaxID=2795018 RepID=A0A7D5XPF3_FERL1|nr:MAG: Hsp20/alpha crystallin family protein [Candidatus Fermentimicrarchaeum limneticum]